MEIQKESNPDAWEAVNMIYPEEEYDDFEELFLELDPSFEDELEDQEIVDAYNKVKEAAPNVTMEQLAQIVPMMAKQMKEKQGNMQEGDKNVEALNSIGMGE